MDNLDLNINNYDLDDILSLFNVSYNYDLNDIKKCKEVLLKLHPASFWQQNPAGQNVANNCDCDDAVLSNISNR